MAKDYGRKTAVRHKISWSKQLLLVLVCFLLGYLSASVFDFTSLNGWVNTQLAQHQVISKPAPQQAQLPKPKFEFYTLLTNERVQPSTPQVANTATAPRSVPSSVQSVVQSAAVAAETVAKIKPQSVAAAVVNAKPVAVTTGTINKNAYLIQVASFKVKNEAERMKASLAIKGFPVSIAMINQQQITWYRVVLGPYASRPEAEKARMFIAKSERIVGMIRRMDA